jgi:hypothetical protein
MGQFKEKGEAMKIGAFVVAAGLVLPAAAALAAQSTLAGDDLRKAISGKTVYLNVSGFELPTGKMSTVAASFSRGDGASDTGKWWVADDQLCQQWSSWMDGKTYCYKLADPSISPRRG